MAKASISEYTEKEFLIFVRSICNADGSTEEEDTQNILEFERLTGHPAGSDLIYYPEPGNDGSPESIVKVVKSWRAAKGLPGFKAG